MTFCGLAAPTMSSAVKMRFFAAVRTAQELRSGLKPEGFGSASHFLNSGSPLSAPAHEPHRIAFYLYELASEFHAHFTQGKGLPHLRFIRQDDEELTVARLALVQAVITEFASGLGLLGVGAPEEMR